MISLGTLGTRQKDSDARVRKLQGKGKALHFGYEADPWGDWRSRYLPKKGLKCWGGAPAQIPKKAGDRGKTERRDAVPRYAANQIAGGGGESLDATGI